MHMSCVVYSIPYNIIQYKFLRLLYDLTVSPGDYVSERQIIGFSACETQKCANVTIVDDSVDEPEERFFYTLMRSSDLDSRITLGPERVGEVIIMDNESM